MSSYAAEWRDAGGEVIATVPGGTECEAPILTKHMAAVTDDGFFETVLRCRNCAGCRRYERNLLRKRLAEHFREATEEIWQVTVSVTLELQSVTRVGLYRSANSCTWEGFFRLGRAGFALIVRGRKPNPRVTRGLRRCSVTVSRIRNPKRARAWRALTEGMLTSRSEYGEDVNRYYMRGLARLPHTSFIIERKGGIRKRHPEAKAGFRAWRDGLTLYPSDRTLTAGLMHILKLARAAAAVALPVNRRRAERGVAASAMTGFRDMAATATPETGLTISQAGRDASSMQIEFGKFAGFVERMTKLARARGS